MCDSIQIIKEQTSNALADIMKQVEILKEEVLLLKRNASEAAVPSGRLKLPTDLTVSLPLVTICEDSWIIFLS